MNIFARFYFRAARLEREKRENFHFYSMLHLIAYICHSSKDLPNGVLSEFHQNNEILQQRKKSKQKWSIFHQYTFQVSYNLPAPESVVWSFSGPVYPLGVLPELRSQSQLSKLGSLVQPQVLVSKSQNPERSKVKGKCYFESCWF